MEVYLQNKDNLFRSVCTLLMQNSCPLGGILASFSTITQTVHTHAYTHTNNLPFRLKLHFLSVCKRFISPNPALKVVHNTIRTHYWEKMKSELRAACTVGDISEPSVCTGSKVQPNELKFLRNPGFQPQSWKHCVAQRPSS